jgi:hypothetical protein
MGVTTVDPVSASQSAVEDEGRVGQVPADTEIQDGTIEVFLPSGATRRYTTYEEIAADLISGAARLTCPARLRAGTDDGGETAAAEWPTLEQVAGARPEIRSLYQPVWTLAMKGLSYGIGAGIVLKLIDTTATMFATNDRLGILWLLMLGGLVASRWFSWAPLLVVLQGARAGVPGNVYVMLSGVLFGSALTGALFGGPIGMMAGTLLGYCRRAPRAADATPEGTFPLKYGLLLPSCVLAAAAYTYVTWFLPLASRIVE